MGGASTNSKQRTAGLILSPDWSISLRDSISFIPSTVTFTTQMMAVIFQHRLSTTYIRVAVATGRPSISLCSTLDIQIYRAGQQTTYYCWGRRRGGVKQMHEQACIMLTNVRRGLIGATSTSQLESRAWQEERTTKGKTCQLCWRLMTATGNASCVAVVVIKKKGKIKIKDGGRVEWIRSGRALWRCLHTTRGREMTKEKKKKRGGWIFLGSGSLVVCLLSVG